jgi:probable HAF family extracellular repeat protein
MWTPSCFRGPARRRKTAGARLHVEQLETRWCPASYAVTDLGTLGGPYAAAYAINNGPQPTIVGEAAVPSPDYYHATLWEWVNGVPTLVDLDTRFPATSDWYLLRAQGVNDGRRIVGAAKLNGADRAFFWDIDTASAPTPLGTLGGSSSGANGVNSAGVVVGNAATAIGDNHAVVWENPQQNPVPLDLNDLQPTGGSGWVLTSANAVNARQIACTGQLNGQQHAVLYTDNDGVFGNGGGVITDLGTLRKGGWSQARGLNGAGNVVGVAQATTRGLTGYDAFLWSPRVANGTSGTMSDLGTFSGTYSSAFGINDSGLIVGRSTYTPIGNDADSHAFLWQSKSTGMQDLNNLIPSNTGWTLNSARAINAAGWIVGYGWNTSLHPGGDDVAILLTPTSGSPQPAAATATGPATPTRTSLSVDPLVAEALTRWAAGADPDSSRGSRTVINCTFTNNRAVGGVDNTGGAFMGAGIGGNGGNGFGGSLFKDGLLTDLANTGTPATPTVLGSTITGKLATGGSAGTGGSTGLGEGSGAYFAPGGTVCLDVFTSLHLVGNAASTSDNGVFGIFTLCP